MDRRVVEGLPLVGPEPGLFLQLQPVITWRQQCEPGRNNPGMIRLKAWN